MLSVPAIPVELWDQIPPVARASIPARVWEDLASNDSATRAGAGAALEAAGPQAVAFLRERLKPVAADARRIDALIEQLDGEQFVQRQQATEELEYLSKIAQPQLEKALASDPPLEVRRRVERLLERLQPQIVPPSEEEMVREAFPDGRSRTPSSDLLRAHPEVAANPGLKIMFRAPDGTFMTPREVIMYAQGEQSLPLAARELAKGEREAAPPVSRTWVRASAAIRVLEGVGNNEARELLRVVAGGADDALPTVEARSALERLKVKAGP